MVSRIFTISFFLVIGAACQPGTPGNTGNTGEDPTQGTIDPPDLPACTTDADCGGDTCCEGGCADLAFNASNCGGCGQSCGADDVCFDSTCVRASFATVCEAVRGVRVSNGLPNDDQAGTSIATALTRACPRFTVETRPQSDPSVADGNGFPAPGQGDLLIVPGGGFVSGITMAMESARLSGVFFSGDDTTGGFYRSDTGAPVANFDIGSIDGGHDYFALQLYPDPAGGRMVLTAYGVREAGTRAAARHFADVMSSDLSAWSDGWYVYEWSDEDGDGTPSAGDAWEQLGSGS